MIILFVLVGVLLLGGGAATIIDGLPYLVLERGFTQVIVGTVLATGGLLMLALSWVLVELRRLKVGLSATVAAAASSAASSAVAPGLSPGGAALAGGAGLAAGAAATALATTPDEPAREPEAEPVRSEDEPDLFSQALSRDDADWHAVSTGPSTPEAAPETQELPVYDEPVWPGDTLPERDKPEPAGEMPDSAPVIELAAIDAEPAAAETAEPDFDHAGRAEPRLDWPDLPAQAEREEMDSPVVANSGDEFDRLRESLAGHLDETGKAAGVGVTDDDDRLREAESWIASPDARREPWFEAPAGSVDEAAMDVEPAMEPRHWPPLTRDVDSDTAESAEAPAETAGEPAAEQDEEIAAPEPAGEPEQPSQDETGHVVVEAPEPAAELAAQPEDEDAPEPVSPEAGAPAQPASSEEGIVGAYQVGDAHFTIYADGSIQARTPDGDYKFASMDELKAYLASEKSRLGV